MMADGMTGTNTQPEHEHQSPLSTQFAPQYIRCERCGQIAHEEIRERASDDEVLVRYGCGHCRWHATRHYHESDYAALLDNDEG
jgi:lysyl-tRNA synthetase class I